MMSCNASSVEPRVIILATLCAAALLLACYGDKCTCTQEEAPPHPNRTSPDSLLVFFAHAYEGKDMDAYSEALSSLYQFEFVPEIAESLSLPDDAPWWDKSEDMVSTENMFNDYRVTAIEIELAPYGSEYWYPVTYCVITGGSAEPGTTSVHGLCREFDPDIKVYIEEPGDPYHVMWVNSSLLDVAVMQDPDSPDLWVILRITERHKWQLTAEQGDAGAWGAGISESAAEHSTWSSLKAQFK